ncbi:rhodanese-like domain-containing protein [Piscinibacter sp. XHJ-5]|uniref:sulfurtransferase n=1 Tax=Piscinibacter sp. XHJ-5 TaxID=3037797 RepID=UPI002452AACF|nr:rhodanese-like domain-containing protein [Piscinibacter sp. XHJ-5]
MTTISQPLVSAPAFLETRQGHVLDVRDRSEYDQGHAPGAVHLDIKRWERLARTGDGALQRVDVWESEIGALGIDGRKPVVVHDDGRMTEAARAWFILQWHGVDVQVLDGGWPVLRALQGFGPEQSANTPTPVVYRRPASHAPTVKLIARDELREALDGDVQVLDARTRNEHVGQDLRSNRRGGHLPGARSVPHAELLKADGTLKSAEKLRERLSSAGVSADRPVVTHCDAGGRAALAALAAVVAGHRDVRAYYLGFSDWAADGACPVVKP